MIHHARQRRCEVAIRTKAELRATHDDGPGEARVILEHAADLSARLGIEQFRDHDAAIACHTLGQRVPVKRP
jgi:hypothetical protein